MLKMLKIQRAIPTKKVLKTGEMLKMLIVFWGPDPPPPKKKKDKTQKVLKTGEMLKMLKIQRGHLQKKCIKLGKC